MRVGAPSGNGQTQSTFGQQKVDGAKMTLPSLKIDPRSKITAEQQQQQARALAKTCSYQSSVGQKRPQPSDLESELAIGKLDQNAEELSHLQSIVPQLKSYPNFAKSQSQMAPFNKSEFLQGQDQLQ